MRTYVIEAETGREAVYAACRAILDDGRMASPRGQQTLELSPVIIEIVDPADTLPTGINRANLTPAIAAAEALQNIGGVSAPELMHRISSFFPKPTTRWGDDVETYGPRLGDQLKDIVALLRADPESREAVASIWRAGDIVGGQAHNLCTVALQFVIRHGALDMLVHMRSNDAWYGLCYDLFQFAQVQLTIARCVCVPVGRYFHAAASLHLYARHWEVADALTAPEAGSSDAFAPRGTGTGTSWLLAGVDARALLRGELPPRPSASDAWYAETLAPYFAEAA